jgi:hypothetical protein
VRSISAAWVIATSSSRRHSRTADADGPFGVTRQGHLRLPAALRRGCRIGPGDRVLLAAEPAEGVVVVHPPAALDAMLTRFLAEVMAGDVA